jgi:pimeloyl-ACP methyl ester carboxylesterase
VRTLTVAPGTDLVLHELGGNGDPALFAHATGFHGRVWAPVAARLKGFSSWAPDLRAHGDSNVGDDPELNWDHFADDLLAVIDELGLVRPLGVGHSKGGAALLLAEQKRPGTFRGLWCWEPVVIPPGPTGPADGGNRLADGALNRRSSFASFEAALANFGSKPPMMAFAPEALEAYVRHGFQEGDDGAVHLKCRPEHESQVYRMGGRHRAWDGLGTVACPVVIARGSLDTGPPAALAGPVVERLPHGRLEVHDDLGHFGPLEDPERVAASIQAFAASI